MWTILESRKLDKQLAKAPRQIKEEYEAWKNTISNGGPLSVRNIVGYWDHALKGEWAGARASSLNDKWRVIYVVSATDVTIMVLEVTAHDYRKKG